MIIIKKIILSIFLVGLSLSVFADFFDPLNDSLRFARRRLHKDRFNNDNSRINIADKKFSENNQPVFYVDIDNKKLGPFNMTALKDKINKNEINKNTLVWTDGMKDWKKAGEVTQLDFIFNSIPPPLPTPAPTPKPPPLP